MTSTSAIVFSWKAVEVSLGVKVTAETPFRLVFDAECCGTAGREDRGRSTQVVAALDTIELLPCEPGEWGWWT